MSTGKGMGTGGGGCESGWRGEKGEEGVCGYLLCSESGSCGGVKGEGGMMGGSLVGVSGLAVGLPVIYLIGLMQFFSVRDTLLEYVAVGGAAGLGWR